MLLLESLLLEKTEQKFAEQYQYQSAPLPKREVLPFHQHLSTFPLEKICYQLSKRGMGRNFQHGQKLPEWTETSHSGSGTDCVCYLDLLKCQESGGFLLT